MEQFFCLYFFQWIVIAADGRIKTSEVKMLTSICGKLEFPSETAKAVLRWVTDMIKLNNKRNRMSLSMGDVDPLFV